MMQLTRKEIATLNEAREILDRYSADQETKLRPMDVETVFKRVIVKPVKNEVTQFVEPPPRKVEQILTRIAIASIAIAFVVQELHQWLLTH